MCWKLGHFGSFFTNHVYSMMLFHIVLRVKYKNRDYLLFLYDSFYQCCMDLSQISTSDWYWRVLRGNTIVMVLIIRNQMDESNISWLYYNYDSERQLAPCSTLEWFKRP